MNNEITYKVSFDKAQGIATFEDTRRYEPLYSGDVSEVYRYMACYFLQMAHYSETSEEFLTPSYTNSNEWTQILKMFSGGFHNGIVHTEEK